MSHWKSYKTETLDIWKCLSGCIFHLQTVQIKIIWVLYQTSELVLHCLQSYHYNSKVDVSKLIHMFMFRAPYKVDIFILQCLFLHQILFDHLIELNIQLNIGFGDEITHVQSIEINCTHPIWCSDLFKLKIPNGIMDGFSIFFYHICKVQIYCASSCIKHGKSFFRYHLQQTFGEN